MAVAPDRGHQPHRAPVPSRLRAVVPLRAAREGVHHGLVLRAQRGARARGARLRRRDLAARLARPVRRPAGQRRAEQLRRGLDRERAHLGARSRSPLRSGETHLRGRGGALRRAAHPRAPGAARAHPAIPQGHHRRDAPRHRLPRRDHDLGAQRAVVRPRDRDLSEPHAAAHAGGALCRPLRASRAGLPRHAALAGSVVRASEAIRPPRPARAAHGLAGAAGHDAHRAATCW